MARPACKVFEVGLSGLLKGIRSRGFCPRPRWISARPGPHKTHGIECHFLNQVSETPVDRQAIFMSFPQIM